MTMLQTTWIALILGFWSSLYLLDVFLKVCFSKKCLHFVLFLQIDWFFFFSINPFCPADQTRYLCKQCRSWWNCSWSTILSGYTLWNIHCLPFCFDFRLFASVDKSQFKNGRVYFRNWGMKELTCHSHIFVCWWRCLAAWVHVGSRNEAH